MKTLILNCLISFLLLGNLQSQNLVSATYKGARSKQQINALFNFQLIKNGVKYYQITYTSPDAKGQMDTLSGLLVIPDNLSLTYPKLVYQHGTSDCKKCVPSFYGDSGGEEGQLGLLFGGLGYVTMLPDFVGMGVGRGFQTYVHGATIVSATLDMMSACESWAAQNNVFTNDQLFITGYSQGGYASMALHKYLEETKGPSSVTAAAHLSGPYSLSGVMRDLILIDSAYNYPAYIPNTVLGFNEAYGNIYSDLSDFFKPEYVNDIKKYRDGVISLTSLNTKLITLLRNNTGASVAGRMIKDDIKSEIISNLDHNINNILRENDVHNWASMAPTKIYYCKADDQVPYKNSLVARDSMTTKGAVNLEVKDVNPNADHGACVTPALIQTVLFFLSLQKITTGTSSYEENSISLFPNPIMDIITISGLKNQNKLTVYNYQGESVMKKQIDNQSYIELDLEVLPKGMYIITIENDKSRIRRKKIIKM